MDDASAASILGACSHAGLALVGISLASNRIGKATCLALSRLMLPDGVSLPSGSPSAERDPHPSRQAGPSLRVLTLSDCGLGSASLDAALFTTLSRSQTLTSLDLSRNALDRVSCEEVARVLRASDSLRLLDLSWNPIHGEAAIALAEGVQAAAQLTTLILSHTGVGDEVCHGTSYTHAPAALKAAAVPLCLSGRWR